MAVRASSSADKCVDFLKKVIIMTMSFFIIIMTGRIHTHKINIHTTNITENGYTTLEKTDILHMGYLQPGRFLHRTPPTSRLTAYNSIQQFLIESFGQSFLRPQHSDGFLLLGAQHLCVVDCCLRLSHGRIWDDKTVPFHRN